VSGSITAEHQADTLVKAYVMGIAQGALRVHWFEALDGDSGPFGLIAGSSGSAPKRPSYTAVSKLIEYLGDKPAYVGWLLIDGQHLGFVFDGPKGLVMVAWAPPATSSSVAFNATVHVVDPHTGAGSDVSTYTLTHSPILVSALPQPFADSARSNFDRPFPWGGDYSAALSVCFAAPNDQRGLHPLGPGNLINVAGTSARDQSQSSALSFTVDPNFLSYSATPIRITAVLRGNTTTSAGFNLKYESTSGWKSVGGWFTVPGSDRWYTQSWNISDPQFVGKWGYNFSFDSDSTTFSNYSVQSVTVTKQ
jgi:hypothetical protein